MRSIVAKTKKLEEQRPAPFANKTQPYVSLSVANYSKRLRSWIDSVMLETDAPTTEQFGVLRVVCDRVLHEFQLEKEGIRLAREHPDRIAAERPLLAFCHGCP